MFLTPEDAFELATKELQHTTVSRLILSWHSHIILCDAKRQEAMNCILEAFVPKPTTTKATTVTHQP
uniref:Uncharacterized protein n=1 Tax=Oryza meridionalis TaxID=40149 RepID=A0A0E0CPN3_9ORYZ